MLTPTELEAYRECLLELSRRLDLDEAQLKDECLRGTGGEASGSLSDLPLHLADLGSHDFEEELSLGLLENEAQLLAEINDALARIEQGVFGRCEACGKAVSRGRLQALPYARHCAPCARKLQGEARQ